MKKGILLLTLSLLMIIPSFSQNIITDSIAKSQIMKLDFLVGNWQGKGWIIGRDREKSEFDQTEKIQYKLDSTIILVEGLGNTNGITTHNAMAIISYNKTDSQFNFHSYLQNGRKGEFSAEIIDDKFYWYPSKSMRYIIQINENGQWFETGEYNREGNWYKFFEMTLDKVE